MAADRHDGDSTREFRLEGLGLLLGGGLLLALLVGAFYLGRWVERRVVGGPEVLAAVDGGPLGQVAQREPDAEAADGLTYFDTVDGGEKQVEAAREMPRPAAPPPSEEPRLQTPASTGAPKHEEGRYYVQVLALRDHRGAAEVIDALGKQGYGARLFPEREGQGMLYKVRVGGYATRDEAMAARDRLRNGDHPGAFLWPAD